MREKRLVAASAIAVAMAFTGTSVGFAAPPTSQQPSTIAASVAVALPAFGVAGGTGTSPVLKKVSLKKVTTNNLNLRQGKGTNTRVLLTIPRNSVVTVVETSGTWSKTSYKKKTGWVASRYLKNAPAAKKPQVKQKAVAYRYTTGFTTLRKGPAVKSQALSVHQRRAKVEFISVSGAWTKVKVGGKTGYISSSHLSTKNPAIANRWLKSTQAVRTTTGKNYRVLTTAQKNSKVEWLRTTGSWTAIRTPKGNGWVPTSTVATSAPKSAPPAKVAYRWTTASVNVRKGASTSHASLGVVPANHRVTHLRASNGWSNVKTSKGTGWISNKFLATTGQRPFAVYGTLRKGQSAYHLLKGRTTKETKTKVPSFSMYLKPQQTWWSFIIPSASASHAVVVERMEIKPALYNTTMKNLDSWERFNPSKPLADQNYNRKLVTDKDGRQSWAYVGASKISKYLTKNGIRVTSGDYLKRF